MRGNTLSFQANIKNSSSDVETALRRKSLWTAACVGLTGLGFLCAVGGFVLSAAAHFESGADVLRTSRAGSLLLFASFPVFFFAAHALDQVAFYQKYSEHGNGANESLRQMRSATPKLMRTIIILFFSVLTASLTANAQQTIFNVPSTDVLDQGKVYGELDAAFKPNNESGVKRFSSFTPRVVAGVGGKIEIGLNVTGNVQPGADATTLVPTAKWKFYDNKGIALIAGTNFYIPVRNRSYKFGTYSYVAGSKTINKTRLTAGVYAASKNVFAANASRAGGQFAVEQTVTSKLSFAADWITGKHAGGYFTPGAIYKFTPKTTGYFGYSIGNTNVKNGNHYFLFEIGYNFN